MRVINGLQTHTGSGYGMTFSSMAQYGATDVGTHWEILGKVRGLEMFYINPNASAEDIAAHAAVLEEHGIAFVIGGPDMHCQLEVEGSTLTDNEAEFICQVICDRLNGK